MTTKNKTPILLFSYGSNMSTKELTKHARKISNQPNKHFNVLDIGYLPKHQFHYLPLYTKTSKPIIKTAKATVIKIPTSTSTSKPMSKVYGTITQVSLELYKTIVKKEGVHHNYYKPVTKVITSLVTKKKYKATLFVMTDTYVNKAKKQCIHRTPNDGILPSILPSIRYENTLVNVAKDYNFPNTYINTYLKKH